MFWIRLLLELMVMISLVTIGFKLKADWPKIHPRSWRLLVLGQLVVTFGNGCGILWAMTKLHPLTLGTLVLTVSYAVLVMMILLTLLPQHKEISHVQSR